MLGSSISSIRMLASSVSWRATWAPLRHPAGAQRLGSQLHTRQAAGVVCSISGSGSGEGKKASAGSRRGRSTARAASATAGGVASPRPATERRRMFTQREDEALHDIVQYHSGSSGIRWSAVQKEFGARFPNQQRSARSLQGRWERLTGGGGGHDSSAAADSQAASAAQSAVLLVMRGDREQMIKRGLWTDEDEEQHRWWEQKLRGDAVPHDQPPTPWPLAS